MCSERRVLRQWYSKTTQRQQSSEGILSIDRHERVVSRKECYRYLKLLEFSEFLAQSRRGNFLQTSTFIENHMHFVRCVLAFLWPRKKETLEEFPLHTLAAHFRETFSSP